MAPYKGTIILVGSSLVWTTSTNYAAAARRAGFKKQVVICGMDVSAVLCSRFERKNNMLYVQNENVEIPL